MYKHIHKLAIPAVFAAIVEPLISLTDTAVAGHFTPFPEIAIAAVGLVGAFLSAIYWIFGQSSNAISSIVSQGIGRGNASDNYGLTASLFFLSFLCGTLIALLFYFSTDFWFELYKVNQEVYATAKAYFQIRVWGLPFSLCTFLLVGAFRGMQNTKWTLWVALSGGLVNIVLDFFLVKFLDFGVTGIAYASLAAHVIMFCFALNLWLRKAKLLGYWKGLVHPKLKLTLGMVTNLALRAFALNFGLQYALYAANAMGKTELAVQNVLVQIWLLSAFLLDGYSHAGNALAGKFYGANNFANLKELERKLSLLMLVLGAAIGLLYYLLDEHILSVFTDSKAIINLGSTLFIWICVTQPINAMAFLMDGLFKGMGKTIYLRNIFFIVTFFVFCPLIFTSIHLDWGMHGLWLAFTVWMFARYFSLLLTFKKIVSV